MQLSIVNEEAAPLARGAGLEVIMDRFMKIFSARLIGNLGWVGVDARVIMRRVKILLVALFLLGICSNGYAQKDPPSLPADPLTDEYYQAFRGFYYDFRQIGFEVMGNEVVTLPLENFSKLSLEFQYNMCSVGMDYSLFYSIILKALVKKLRKPMRLLVIRIFANLVGISWDFKRELSEDEKDKMRQMMNVFHNKFKLGMEHIIEKNRYCFDNNLVKKSGTFAFTESYASVPMEFQMRDLYRSQVPLIRWIQENLPESEEKDRFKIMVESMERKYSIF